MAFIIDAAFDAALEVLRSNVTTLYITSAEATTYAQASTTYKLGTKASPTLGAVTDRSPSGRKTVVSAITDGTVNTNGTATHWALTSGSVLYATGQLSSSQAVTGGNTFTLTAFDVGIVDAT